MGQCMSRPPALDAEMDCVTKVSAKGNPSVGTVYQDLCFDGSIKVTSPIQDVSRASTAAEEPVTLLPAFTTGTTAASSAASTCHPAEQQDLLQNSDKSEEVTSCTVQDSPSSATGSHLQDTAMSANTFNTCSPRAPAAKADSTATPSPVEWHLAPTASATITIASAHKNKVAPQDAAQPQKSCRSSRSHMCTDQEHQLRERTAKSTAERVLAIFAMWATRQLSAEQDRCSSAENAAREKEAALTAAQQLAGDLAQQLITEQEEGAAEKDILRAQQAAAAQLASYLACRFSTKQEGHAAEKRTLRAKLAAAEQRAADLACQVSSEQEARMAAQQAQAAAAAEACDLKWDLATTRWRVDKLERDISAEQAGRRMAEATLQATVQRISGLETALQATQQQAEQAIADAQAKCLASFTTPIFPKISTSQLQSFTHMRACHEI
ncbi:hypothetical protein COCOBI_12-5180 [Coccomyxa sp. Obi]|nr:hypothetical protein COCOBI_12-5180 [Coccomyxa sp. Obi]